MHVVMVSSEVAPYSKSGGMGDVVGALSAALVKAGFAVTTVSPRYGSVDEEGLVDTDVVVRARLGTTEQEATLRERVVEGVRHLFVEHGIFADRQGLYGDQNGSFGDNHLRFALLQRAALEAARHLVDDPAPVFHLHDWQAAGLPAYLDHFYRPLGFFRDSATVLTLHNPMHQGRLPHRFFDDLDLPAHWFSPAGFEWYGDLGLLKCGILHADQLTTVSPGFAWEITRPEGGFGLDALFRGRFADLTGILNGIDTEVWDPTDDPHLPAPFSADDLAGKRLCKSALQDELGLVRDPEAPLMGSVGRLDPQKGTELLLESIPWILDQGAQVAVLGSAAAAHRRFEAELRGLAARFPGRLSVTVGFSEGLAHRIEAGADLFAMPSLFEPCGLNQLYSQRYGTLPIVRRTGGLADSVEEGRTGYTFDAPTGYAFRGAVHRALAQHGTPAQAAIRDRAMRLEVGWSTVVGRYVEVFERAIEARRAG
ncbi:MAG: glycogen synthase [Myxococcales bacterium]|nr:glycogen synthase [Myxococcales bacterium]